MPKEFYAQADLDKLLDKKCDQIEVEIELVRELVGGQPATDAGVKAFIKHHLKIDPETQAAEFEEAFARIKKEELLDTSEKDLKGMVKVEGGEVPEEKVYAINVVRRSAHGAFLLEHMVKACMKNAATRTNYFIKHKGAKGDLSEMGLVAATERSLMDPDRPWEIYAYDANGGPAQTAWRVFRGSVNSSGGKKSIVTHCECLPEGSRFKFRFNWVPVNLKVSHLPVIFAAASRIGLGSAKAFGLGRFKVISLKIEKGTEGKEE